MHSRAQISAEFIVFIILAFILSIGITFSAAKQSKDFRVQREGEIIKSFALKIQRELLIASYVEDGYVRTLQLPNEIENINYTLISTNSTIIVKSRYALYVFSIPSLNGTLIKGQNTINKTGGGIHIN